jgi:antitoxin (DNA-binding transcriptional repressor) of toxin-antitoxin stability system
MIVVNIYEAKAKLSEFIEAIERGERVLICKRNRPVAELRAVAAARTEPRPIGLAKGHLDVPAAFFEPLPDEVVDAFYADSAPRHSRVADGPPEDVYSRPTTPAGRRRR